MNALILSLALAAFGDESALPAALRLDETRPRQEQDTQRPEDGRMGFMEHVYRYSELDGGLLWTFWDKDLDLENDIGWFVRYGVGLGEGDNLAITLAYRHYDYDNTELPGGAEDHVMLRSVLAGVAFRLPITRDFEFAGHGSAGVMRWDTSGANLDDDTGPVISAEGALIVRLHEVLRFRFGAALDWARTEFHEDTHENVLSLTLLFGLEIGGR